MEEKRYRLGCPNCGRNEIQFAYGGRPYCYHCGRHSYSTKIIPLIITFIKTP